MSRPNSPGGASPINVDAEMANGEQNPAVDELVAEYLRARGYGSMADTLKSSGKKKDELPETTVDTEELVKKLAPLLARPQTTTEAPISLESLFATLGTNSEEILTLDPTDRSEGYRELEAWVEGSLDMYRPEFRPMLFPIFCHFYLDLIQSGFRDAALKFYNTFTPSLSTSHANTLHHLSTLLLPSHVQNDDLAQRFREEKYVVRMSRSGFGLLLGWLTEGVGGEAVGSGDGFTGEKGKRGRQAVMRVVNNHLRFEVESANPSTTFPNWEESTGLLSSLIPQASGSATKMTDPNAYNLLKGDLKLGPAPMGEELRSETERSLREQSMLDREPTTHHYDTQFTRPQPPPGVISPTESDLLPRPPTYKTADIEREVHAVRDAKKRIKLEPSLLQNLDWNSPQANGVRGRALPSVCAYTLHNVPEGAPCMSFSQDTSIMAAGFAESYIRLWSLKGEKLRGMRSNFASGNIKDSESLRKIKEKKGSTTRKLIGHSGPVYSVDFDPCSGSAAPPKYLLSCSADATTRLWSMDTLTNVVAFRGHNNPVWDVKWSPMGIYFATGSRDRTARLWSTDRTTPLRIYAGHLSDVDCLKFHPNSLYLATGSSDWTSRLWDVQKGSCVRVFIGQQGSITSLAISPDGRYLATGGEDLAINLWDIGSGKRIKKMTGHTGSIYSLAFSQETSLLVSGGADWTVRCWDVKGAGGLPTKAPKENGDMGKFGMGMLNGDAGAEPEEENTETTDMLASFPTKRTPITNIQFTSRNLCLVGGNFLAP
ncbi:TFIID and SAGA subunit [Cylindrobasidium torrendii FP15055 ss-10]|uniref:TFIID and SAGA subunit n=1 Tax=Cylindrobasidium torrendii FP15055 ss-10 TaxID=1314674 RepID=A0A0D7B3W4_9AGAR|nr:TFIID and SAGA subunit [Cylindrobasidium torrendii FP15055 ss-10]